MAGENAPVRARRIFLVSSTFIATTVWKSVDIIRYIFELSWFYSNVPSTFPQKHLALGSPVCFFLQLGHNQEDVFVAACKFAFWPLKHTVILHRVGCPLLSTSNVEELITLAARPNGGLSTNRFKANHALIAVAHYLGNHVCGEARMTFGKFCDTLSRWLLFWFGFA